MPRPRRPTRPLDDAGRALAERWLPFARHHARRYGRRWPWLADEYESACLFILCDAAAAYPTSAAAAKGLAFSTYLDWRLRGARREIADLASPQGYRGIADAGAIPAPAGPTPAEVADGFDDLLRRLPVCPRERAILARYYDDGGGRWDPAAYERVKRILGPLRRRLAR